MSEAHAGQYEARPFYVFHVEARVVEDALLRVLAPFAVSSAELRSAQMTRFADYVSIRIEAAGLDAQCAVTLLHRLRNMPMVRAAGLGWRRGASTSEIPRQMFLHGG